MSERIRSHIRGNVIGYVALFVAFTGTAYAVDGPLPGTNQVGTADIINGEVKAADIATNGVNTAEIANNGVQSEEVRDDNLAGGGLQAADLSPSSVSSSEIATNAVRSAEVATDAVRAPEIAASSVSSSEIATDAVGATEVADNSIDSGEIVDFGLSNQDIGVLFAEVNPDGTLASSSGGVSVLKLGGAGTYEVDFGRNVTACTAVATVGPAGFGSSAGEVNVADRTGNAEAVFVDTNDSSGTAGDRPFRLVVVC